MDPDLEVLEPDDVIEDDVDVPKPDLHADVLSLLDAWDVARDISKSQVDQLTAISPHLDRLTRHYDDVDTKVHGAQPKEPDAPKADAKPLAPAARPGATPATPPR